MRPFSIPAAVTVILVTGTISHGNPVSPYAGRQTREIKALVDTRTLLSAAQVARYNELRGYTSSTTPAGHDSSKRHRG